jgi:hypothetical protein
MIIFNRQIELPPERVDYLIIQIHTRVFVIPNLLLVLFL